MNSWTAARAASIAMVLLRGGTGKGAEGCSVLMLFWSVMLCSGVQVSDGGDVEAKWEDCRRSQDMEVKTCRVFTTSLPSIFPPTFEEQAFHGKA